MQPPSHESLAEPSQSISIRTINPDSRRELNAAASLSLMDILENWPEARLYPDKVPNFSHKEMSHVLSKAVMSSDHLCLLASRGDEEVVGTLVASVRGGKPDPRAEIFCLYFLPTSRDKGLIASVFNRLEEWAAEKKLPEIRACVHVSCSAEISMHRELGFRQVSTIDTSSPNGHFVVFSKSVEDPFKLELLEERDIPDEIAMHSVDNQI